MDSSWTCCICNVHGGVRDICGFMGLETWIAKRSVSLSAAGNRDDTSSHTTIYFYVLKRLLASQKTSLIHGHQRILFIPHSSQVLLTLDRGRS